MAELKVYGGLIHAGRQRRTIVAAKSRAEVCRLTGLSDSQIKGYWSVTGNKAEIDLAMSRPGVVFMSDESGYRFRQYEPVIRVGNTWTKPKD